MRAPVASLACRSVALVRHATVHIPHRLSLFLPRQARLGASLYSRSLADDVFATGEGDMRANATHYMKPLARARVESTGERQASEDEGAAQRAGPSRSVANEDDGHERAPVERRSSAVRRRDSAPIYPASESGEGTNDDGFGDVEVSDGSERSVGGSAPTAPPTRTNANGARTRRHVRGAMAHAAPLPPWADARARRRFIQEPFPNDGSHARCHVLRRRGPFSLFPTYVLYLDGRETSTATLADAVPILVARKRKKAKCTQYVIGDDGAERAVSESSASYVGKLKANFFGTRFELFDSGARPRAWGTSRRLNDDSDSDDDEHGPARRALADIRYAVNVLGASGPRCMSMSLFGATALDERFVPIAPHELDTARPSWNAACSAYVLNFNGRVTRPSVKNFQMMKRRAEVEDVSGRSRDATASRAELERTEDDIVIQFGRVDDDLFTLDFAHPLSPLQAFAACLSAFESKFARE